MTILGCMLVADALAFDPVGSGSQARLLSISPPASPQSRFPIANGTDRPEAHCARSSGVEGERKTAHNLFSNFLESLFKLYR